MLTVNISSHEVSPHFNLAEYFSSNIDLITGRIAGKLISWQLILLQSWNCLHENSYGYYNC